MIEHEAVAEAGVIGKPDDVAMEIVKAFVTLNEGYENSRELLRSLNLHCRTPARASGRAARDRSHRSVAKDTVRQDHAPPAESA